MRPYDFRNENYSKLGYIYEGITTYMGDLYLLKSGVFNITEYLNELQVQFQRHFDNPARFYASVGDSSFDTWLDGYVQGAPGKKVSIYVEGCLLAFVTDYFIRKNTKNKYGKNIFGNIYKIHKKNNTTNIENTIKHKTIHEPSQLH